MDNPEAEHSRFFAHMLVGPTASGKSSVAQYLAEQSGAMVVSADSMNLYRGMDIGTAKPTELELGCVDYGGVDLADPTEKFSVAAYLRAVRPAFESGRDIIVAGGTGLYVKCLTEGFDDVPPENSALRGELEALSFEELVERARTEAPKLFEGLTPDDRENPRRLVRILERGEPSCGKWNAGPKPRIVGLHVEREVLHTRIAKRVDQMYADGLLEEARSLMELDLSPTALQAIGYAEAFAALRGEMTESEAKERTVIRTRQLAKRQMTWFRNQLNVEWVDVADYADLDRLADAVAALWERLGPTPVVF